VTFLGYAPPSKHCLGRLRGNICHVRPAPL
jgi:hypothetical protein